MPSGLLQLLFATDQGDVYYSDEEDPSGTFTHLLADRSGNAGDLREKRQGHCLDFDGATQYASTSGRVTTGSVTKLFVSAWVKPSQVASGKLIVGEYTSSIGWTLYQSGDAATLFVRNGVSWDTTDTASVLAVSEWVHLGVYFNNGEVQFFVDGEASVSDTLSITETTDYDLPLAIGKFGSSYFGGSLYDVRVYEGAAADEAAANIGGIYTFNYLGSPTAHYWLQEEAGSTAYDASGNGNHATITGYVSDMRVTDEGVKYSVANEVGYSSWISLNSATDDWVEKPLHSILENDTTAFFVRTTANAGQLIGNYDFAVLPGISISGSGNSLTIGYANSNETIALPYPINDNEVHHVAVNWSTTGAELYYDGQYVDTTGALVNGLPWNAIGRRFSPGGTFYNSFNGSIFDIRLYRGGHLTSSQILTLANGGDVPGNVIDYSTFEYKNNASLVYMSPDSISTTQDALGGTLTYTGRVPMYGLAKHVAWQGNGADVYVDTGDSTIPTSDDFLLCFSYLYGGNLGREEVVNQGNVYAARFRIMSSTVNGSSYAAGGLYILCGDPATDFAGISNALEVGKWSKITVSRVDGECTLTVNANGDTKTTTFTTSVDLVADRDLSLLAFWTGGLSNSGALGPVSITTGGVTTTYVPIEGTRNVAKLTSDGSDTKIIYNAVKNGTLPTLYTQGDGSWRLPHIENGARWASQNLFSYSEVFDDPFWTAARSTLATSSEITPDGNQSGYKLIEQLTNNSYLLYSSDLQTTEILTASIYCKSDGDARYLNIRVQDSSAGTSYAVAMFNPDTGEVVTTDADATYSILSTASEDVGNGWYRFSIAVESSVTDCRVSFDLSNTIAPTWETDGTVDYAGDGTSGVLIYGAQFNEGTTPLPYQKTGANPWPTSALIPLDAAGNSPDGNEGNIAAGTIDRFDAVQVDRTGGVLSPIDYELGLDQLTDEGGEQWVESIEGDW
jgi:hypothetical protein